LKPNLLKFCNTRRTILDLKNFKSTNLLKLFVRVGGEKKRKRLNILIKYKNLPNLKVRNRIFRKLRNLKNQRKELRRLPKQYRIEVRENILIWYKFFLFLKNLNQINFKKNYYIYSRFLRFLTN
jgi:hypothetical protein